MSTQLRKVEFYNQTYKHANFFRYGRWLYEPYVSSLIKICGLPQGASVLDVGCGQGFFSYLFGKNGMKVRGIDTSETGVCMAKDLYGHLGISFSVGDIETATFSEKFDCIFVRSCSLYNSPHFPQDQRITDSFMKHLKVGGKFIFAYNSNFSSKLSQTWRYHTLDEVRQHFTAYSDATIFFVNRFVTYVLRIHSFKPFVSQFNAQLSKVSGLGGDLVCILRKDSEPEHRY